MDYAQAFQKAQRIQSDLSPFCERIEIAGSVRRGKQTNIKDIEIVCVPKTMTTLDMFGSVTGDVSMLENSINDILKAWRAMTTKNGEKYKAIIFPDATKLDLFIVTRATWGYQFAIRTGPAEYSHWLVTPRRFGGALPSHLKIKDARVYHREKVLDTSEEGYFFRALQISPIPLPGERVVPSNFNPKRQP